MQFSLGISSGFQHILACTNVAVLSAAKTMFETIWIGLGLVCQAKRSSSLQTMESASIATIFSETNSAKDQSDIQFVWFLSVQPL